MNRINVNDFSAASDLLIALVTGDIELPDSPEGRIDLLREFGVFLGQGVEDIAFHQNGKVVHVTLPSRDFIDSSFSENSLRSPYGLFPFFYYDYFIDRNREGAGIDLREYMRMRFGDIAFTFS